jgi:hypothetical protein
MSRAADMKRGRILTGQNVINFEPPSPERWVELEAAFGQPLAGPLRHDINVVSLIYAMFASRFASSKTRSQVKRRLSKWRQETAALRQYVWSDPVEPQTKKGINFNYPLLSFAGTLDSAIASVDAVFSVLKELPSNQSNEAFSIWLALIRRFFEKHGIRTSAASGDKMSSNSPFIRFIDKFQECLRIQSILYGPASLSKYVQKATRQFEHLPSDLLILKLVFSALAIQSARVKNATNLVEALSPETLKRMSAKRAGKKSIR